jgi:hypothetical protein
MVQEYRPATLLTLGLGKEWSRCQRTYFVAAAYSNSSPSCFSCRGQRTGKPLLRSKKKLDTSCPGV